MTGNNANESSELQEFHRIVDPLEPEIGRALWRVTRDTDAAEDAFQIAMLTIWQRLSVVRVHPNPRALVLRICIDSGWYVRRQQKRIPETGVRLEEQVTSQSQSASQKTVFDELTQDLFSAIESLPEQQSICAWLRFVEQWKAKEIACSLQIAEPTVRKHIERARKQLALRLRSHLKTD